MAFNQSNPFSVFYESPYFSGSQAGVYIGDVYIDEITSIRYRGTQQKIPIYGYASQLFDRVAPGPFIVEGEFTINFKESAYLWAVLERYEEVINNPQDPDFVGPNPLAAIPNTELGDAVGRLFDIRPVASTVRFPQPLTQAGVEYVRSGVPVARSTASGSSPPKPGRAVASGASKERRMM